MGLFPLEEAGGDGGSHFRRWQMAGGPAASENHKPGFLDDFLKAPFPIT
jgi:hypothetical protein